ncbi:hypothetical protein AAG906_005857 [Vitis piasezkii]
MRVSAKVGPHELIVLIDSGSTHNFINERIAELLQLPMVPTEPFNVKVANVLLQGIPFTLTLYSLPLIGLDMVLGLGKCAFGQQEVEYLGYVVTPQSVKVDQGKIKAMLNWPRPTNVSDLRGFLGLIGYYRKFVRNYGVIARPLTNLLKKGQFRWTEEAKDAFKALKQTMTSTPTLTMPNFNEPFIIESMLQVLTLEQC